MFTSKKRAAIVVPTAFLIACSGMVAAPAMAQDGGSAQAIINDQPIGSSSDVAAGATEIIFTNGSVDDPATEGTQYHYAAGQYIIKQSVTTVTGGVSETEHTYTGVDHPGAAGITHDATGLAQGRTVVVTLYKIADDVAMTEGAISDAETAETLIGTGSAVETVSLNVKAAIAVSAASPKTVAEGAKASGPVIFQNLIPQRSYVVLNNGEIEAVPAGSTTASATVAPQQGDAGTWGVELFDVTVLDGYAAATTDEARLAILETASTVAPHTVTITDTAATAEFAGDLADGVTAGSELTVNFTNLPAPAEGGVLTVQVLVDDAVDAGRSTTWKLEDLGSATNGFYAKSYSFDTLASDQGKTITVKVLSGTEEVALTAPGVVVNDEVLTASATTVQDRDSFSVTPENLIADQEYVLVRTFTSTTGATITQIVGPSAGSALGVQNVAASASSQGTYKYDLYLAPTGTAKTAFDAATTPAAKAAVLSGVLATTEVEVTADAARAVATPEEFNAAGQTLTFSFQNLPNTEDAPLVASDYAAIVKKTVGTEVTESAHAVTKSGNDLQLQITSEKDATYEVTLYALTADVDANWANVDKPVDEVRKGSQVTGAADAALVATSKYVAPATPVTPTPTPEDPEEPADPTDPEVPGEEPTEPEVPGEATTRAAWVGDGLDTTVLPEAFHAIPTNVKANEIFVGDWDGDGLDTPAYRIPGSNIFKFAATQDFNTTWTEKDYGRPTDTVYVGDWNGDGKDGFGVRRGNQMFLKQEIGSGEADVSFSYGKVGDTVIVGDWNNDKIDTIGVRRENINHLRDDFAGGQATTVYAYGKPTDAVVVADLDGDGVDTLSVRRGNQYFINNLFRGGEAQSIKTLGLASDAAVVGNVEKDGKDFIFAIRLGEIALNADGTIAK